MKKTIELLNEVVAMGFNREEALRDIDACLDGVIERTESLYEEEISNEMYSDIKAGFLEELEARKGII